MPVIGAIATIGAAAIGAATKGGGSEQSGYTLPPEYELQYIKNFQQQMQQMQEDYAKVQSLAQSYSQKIDALNSLIGGGDKAEGLKALQQSNYNIALQLGSSSEDLVKNGFLTAEDKADVDKMSHLAGSPGEIIQDPALEQQIKDQRARTEMDMRRQGASPAAIAQGLQKFDIAANQARFQRSQDLRSTGISQIGQVVSTRAGLRAQGFGQAQSTLGQNMGFTGQALGLLGSNYSNQLNASNNALQMQQALRGEGREAFTTMGKFMFSDRTQQFLSEGSIGPGSIESQIGARGGSYTSRLGGGGANPVVTGASLSPDQIRAGNRFRGLSDQDILKSWKNINDPMNIKSDIWGTGAAQRDPLYREMANRGLL